MSVEDAMEELQSGSLNSFVARRKVLAKALRDGGDKKGARQVTAVPKPSLPAWVLNQLVRRHRATVEAAIAGIDRQRDLQLGALSGQLDTVALAAGKQAEKSAMGDVAEHAAAILEDDGHAASKTNIDRVTASLRAASLDPEARPLLEAGRLVRDVAQGGFEAVASQLDPALLLAALSAKGDAPTTKRSKVDGMFARSARSDASEAAPRRAETPAPSPRAKRGGQDRVERLAAAHVAAATARSQIEEQRATVARCEARIVDLENELNGARAEARSARRKLGDFKVKLEQAEKRIRVLND
jgi:hypothetical protein